MSWIFLLLLVAVGIAFFALTGQQPDKGRQVGHTRLMTAARVIFVILALIVVYVIWTR